MVHLTHIEGKGTHPVYTYRIGLALLMAAIYALVFAGFHNSEFMTVISIMALIVGTMLAVAGARSAKNDEEQRHRELLEALGKTDIETKE